MTNEEACAEMMEALSIEESTQRIEPVQSWSKLNANEDMLDGQPPAHRNSQRRVTPIEGRKQVRRNRSCLDRRQLRVVLRCTRCCLRCGYLAPHRMLLQVHLATCRKTSSWPALYSSVKSPIESEGTQTVPVGLE